MWGGTTIDGVAPSPAVLRGRLGFLLLRERLRAGSQQHGHGQHEHGRSHFHSLPFELSPISLGLSLPVLREACQVEALL